MTVSIFGSTINGLATENSDMDLCITSPEMKDISDYKRIYLENESNSIFNMDVLAKKLRSHGMCNITVVKKARVPICTFQDQQYGIDCDINVNNCLGIENTNLSVEYMKLDSRVKPFLFAFRLFVKSKGINDCRKGFIGTCAYTMIGLHYLMFVQKPPVIPCLQKLTDAICKSPDCHFKTARPIGGCDVRYHDCVYIENVMSNCFINTLSVRRNDSTIWHSSNGKNVGELIIEVFQWLSSTQNILKPMSITSNGHIPREMNWRKHDAIFPDPFDLTRNIISTCTAIGARVISQEFERAYNHLRRGSNFVSVLNVNDRVPRPIDPKSMEYRFGPRR
ncbi:hypothetical protein INT48_003008 [Thamnidium elegans]|uniref:Poly(A) RNA polymerase mitochondrial-like central palm domain-containing protein n=1 Tax=Thamnidium elegans TaxID=101142 RepID=A0A8H7SL85_9FUNG|nr:hypothetical protein INT48_003008 [Thamnidium elegans]